ncbi:DUF1749 domain-containing protein [Thiomicrorhabdus sp. zzn3]|uniref:DUF1749 domain-containing protein n=1 Tax=Thiomicrorhabdus sp. zzn3 TaxID=3039775 RepID=UPI00243691AE|nr:DUF1749 domain-containing protein [Thiomicrorhabdus sp. zzn3]MDG6778474.1 DUF1749 domain-containing protein [Thiomicrorhabdus sp. zzn3]
MYKYQKKILTVLTLIATFIFSAHVQAKVVTHTITPQNVTAEAEYLPGDINKPAVLILHGFLTTNQFHTVKSMSQGFHDAGYSTLSPTLTLNINHRKQSLKCNSIHTHTLQGDIEEVIAWINWLEQQGYKEVVLVGHSSGSQELLALLENYHDPRIKLAIFTSLFYLNGEELGTRPQEIEFAKQAVLTGNKRPHKFNFLFCKDNYYATPESFYSYQKIDRAYILQQLEQLKIPHYTIMGSADKRYKSTGENWLDELRQSGTHLIVVDGANHFFSSEYEFDLQDHCVKILDSHFNSRPTVQ